MAYHAESVKLRTAISLTKTNLLSLQFLPVYGRGNRAAQDQAGPLAHWCPGAQPSPSTQGVFLDPKHRTGPARCLSREKVLIAKPDNLSWIPRTHVVEREREPTPGSCPLTSPTAMEHTCLQAHTQEIKCNFKNKKIAVR